MAVSIILFIVIFCIIVLSHEFGHFIIAKVNGINVSEFYIGMGPTLLSFTKGGTKYAIKLFPIGGACVFEGDDGLAAKEGEISEGAFPNAPVWARIATVLAGPIFNFLIAFLFAVIIVSYCGVLLPVIGTVSEGGGAQQAGIQQGDIIREINGKSIHLQEEVSLSSMLNKGEVMEITYERNEEEYTTLVTPVYDEEADRYYIGITSGELLECNAPQTMQYAVYTMKYTVDATFKSLGMLVKGQLTKDDIAGPVGIVKVVDETYDAAKTYGITSVILSMLNIALLLSVNLGILNLLPLPALDGGRLVFMLIEVVRGKPVPPEKEGMVHMAGMVALMLLMVFVLFNDITKFF